MFSPTRALGSLNLVVIASFFVSLSATAELSPQTIQKLMELDRGVSRWAPTKDGVMALDPKGQQADILERSGLLCLYGDIARCADVRDSQDEEGRFWRSPQLKHNDPENSFSRDQLNGVFAYLIATRDTGAAERLFDYIETHDRKFCADATDNRCDPVADTWGMMYEIWRYLGLKRTWKMFKGSLFDDTNTDAGMRVVRRGYELTNYVYTVLLRQRLGKSSKKMTSAAETAAIREPLNFMAVFAAEGPSENAAKRVLDICTPDRAIPDYTLSYLFPWDHVWNRALERNSFTGEVMIFADSINLFADATKMEYYRRRSVPAKYVVDGWDCLIGARLLLSS
ncbi:MAG: hypothetical protein EOP09_19825, partial [Proteobacteria bacterium]